MSFINHNNPIIYLLTCLNCTMMSLESSISLNIPSNLLVNAAPHSEGNITKVTRQFALPLVEYVRACQEVTLMKLTVLQL